MDEESYDIILFLNISICLSSVCKFLFMWIPLPVNIFHSNFYVIIFIRTFFLALIQWNNQYGISIFRIRNFFLAKILSYHKGLIRYSYDITSLKIKINISMKFLEFRKTINYLPTIWNIKFHVNIILVMKNWNVKCIFLDTL